MNTISPSKTNKWAKITKFNALSYDEEEAMKQWRAEHQREQHRMDLEQQVLEKKMRKQQEMLEEQAYIK